MVVMAHDRPLPLRAPGRRAGRYRAGADRSTASARRRDATATDKTFLHVIEAAPHDARVGAYLNVLLLSGKRDDREMRARLGVHLTAEALAIATIVAGAEGHAVGIDVGLRHVGGWSGKRVITKAFRRLLEQRSSMALDHRRIGIVTLPRSLEHIAAVDLLAAQVACLA